MPISGLWRRLSSNPYFLTFASGALLVLSFPPFNLHVIAWIALVPFLYFIATVRNEKKRKWGVSYYDVQVSGVLLGGTFYYGTLYWLYNIFGILALVLIAIMLIFTFLFAFFLNFVLSRWKNTFTLVLYPAMLWTAIEYFKSEGWWLKFSWMNLGYSQHNSLPILQFASIFGQYGISFLIVLVNSTIVFLIINRANRKLVAKTLLAALLGLGIVLCFGILSLRKHHEPDIRVGLVQNESSDFSVYEQLTEQLPDDVDFVLWPEYAVPEFLEEENDLLDRIQDLAYYMDSYLILGAKDRAEIYSSSIKTQMMTRQGASLEEIDELLKFYNTAFIFSPQGDIVGKYYKTNPIQFFTDGVAGQEFPAFETDLGKIGIVICYDADYSYAARRVVRNGAEMLFIPTYDSITWSELQHMQHSAMTSMRAVENGRYIARATTSGISQIIDPSGRIAGSIDIGESGVATGYIERIDGMTFYTRYGFVLPYFCGVASLLVILYGFFTRRSTASQNGQPAPLQQAPE